MHYLCTCAARNLKLTDILFFSVKIKSYVGYFILYWIPKLLSLVGVVLGIVSTLNDPDNRNSGYRIAQGVLFAVSWLIELFGNSIPKVQKLTLARSDWYRTNPGNQTRNSRIAHLPCCACDTTWPLLLFHIVAVIFAFVGFFADLNPTLRAIFTTLPPFFLFTGVAMVDDKIKTEIQNISGSLITHTTGIEVSAPCPYACC